MLRADQESAAALLESSAGTDILEGKPAPVHDVHEETESKHGNHDGNYRRGHEVAAEFEQTVTGAEKLIVSGDSTELASERIDH